MILFKGIRKLLMFILSPLFDLSKFERKQIYRYSSAVSRKTETEDIVSLIKKLAPVSVAGIPLVRFGSAYDGGYLIPDDLDDIEACFSPGVGALIDFENDCLSKGMKVFLADNTIDENTLPLGKFNYTNKNIGSYSTETLITIDEWVKSSDVKSSSDLLLQMDIEGHEYAAISNLSKDTQNWFRIIAVEFHGLNNLWGKDFFITASEVFNKLLETHMCVHIHPNNWDPFVKKDNIKIPISCEFTFLRKDRIKSYSKVTVLPHPLDTDNAQHNRTMVLPSIWYK